MNEKEIFALALGIQQSPWRVREVKLDTTAGSLDIYLDFPPGTRFPRPGDGKLCPVYDTQEKSWRHLNFFQYQCYFPEPAMPRFQSGSNQQELAQTGNLKPLFGLWPMQYALTMKLSKTTIEDFKRCYESEYNKEISDADAEQLALRVLRVFEILCTDPTDPSDADQLTESEVLIR